MLIGVAVEPIPLVMALDGAADRMEESVEPVRGTTEYFRCVCSGSSLRVKQYVNILSIMITISEITFSPPKTAISINFS